MEKVKLRMLKQKTDIRQKKNLIEEKQKNYIVATRVLLDEALKF